jgi:predicted transcriptional regulator
MREPAPRDDTYRARLAGSPRLDETDQQPGAARRAAGALEAEVLGIVREAGAPLSPGEVRQRVSAGQRGELSYSTVVTIMSRLYEKGLLARQRAGRAFTYTPVDEASVAASRMSQALGSGSDRDAVLSRFVSGLSGRDARLLRRLLAGGGDPAAGGEGSAAAAGGSAAGGEGSARDDARPPTGDLGRGTGRG